MTREEAKQYLEAGKYLQCEGWTFGNYGMYCDCAGCCDDSFGTVEEMLDQIEFLGEWEDVWVI